MPEVRERIRTMFPRFINSTGEFIITSQVHRTQKQNIEDCVTKIYECVRDASKVPAATSEAQKKKVQALSAAANQKRIENKKKLQDKKRDRKGPSRFD
jgi:hypothetical protein